MGERLLGPWWSCTICVVTNNEVLSFFFSFLLLCNAWRVVLFCGNHRLHHPSSTSNTFFDRTALCVATSATCPERSTLSRAFQLIVIAAPPEEEEIIGIIVH